MQNPVIAAALATLLWCGTASAAPAPLTHAQAEARMPPFVQALEATDVRGLRAVLAAHPELLHSDAKGARQVGTQLLTTFITMNRSAELVTALLDAGVAVETKNPDVLPPLFAAVVVRRDDLVRLCVARRVNVNAYHDGLTALHFAVMSSQGKDADEAAAVVVKTLIAAGANANLPIKAKGMQANGAQALTARDLARMLGNPKVRSAVGP